MYQTWPLLSGKVAKGLAHAPLPSLNVLESRASAVQYLEIICISKGRRASTGRHAGCSPNAIATMYPARLANPLRAGLLLHCRLRRYLSPASLFCMPPRTFCMPAWCAKGAGKVSQAAMMRPLQPDTTAALSCARLSEGLGDAAGGGGTPVTYVLAGAALLSTHSRSGKQLSASVAGNGGGKDMTQTETGLFAEPCSKRPLSGLWVRLFSLSKKGNGGHRG